MSAKAASINDLIEVARILRKVDSAVDIARGWTQLRILLIVGHRGRASVNELVQVLKERRKTILDSLRKMKIKGLILETDGYIVPSEKGREIYALLSTILTSNIGLRSEVERTQTAAVVYDIPRNLTRAFYLYDAIIAIGSSPKNELPLETLAYMVKLSPSIIDDYLKPFAQGENALFRRVIKERSFLFFKKRRVFYELTKEGLKVFYRLPAYLKYKNNKAAKLFRMITRTGHPRVVIKRMALIISMGSVIVMALNILLPPLLTVLTLSAWILLLSFFAVLIEFTY